MQSTLALGDRLVKGLALDLGDLELLGRGLAAAVAGREAARAPGRATVDLGEVGQLAESGGVAQGHVDNAVVGEGGHGGEGGGLLAAAGGGGGDEEPRVLAVEAARLPLTASAVPEGLPLGGEVAEARGDAEQEGVVAGQRGRVGQRLDVGGLGGRVHLTQDLFGEGLGDPVWVVLLECIPRGSRDYPPHCQGCLFLTGTGRHHHRQP